MIKHTDSMQVIHASFVVVFLLVCSEFAAFAQTPSQAERQFTLKAESPVFTTLFAEGARLEKIAGGFGFTEGPVWDPRGFLYVSDELQNRLSRVYPDGRAETLLEIGDPDGSTLDAKQQLITTASVLRAIIRVSPDGTYKILADRFEGKRFNSPNDVVLGPDGAIYFTDPNLDLPKGEPQEISYQGVYRLGPDGSVQLLTKDLAEPNGLAFSPDGSRLYVDDTRNREIWVYHFGQNAQISNGRLFGKEDGPPHSGVPDGMRVDVNGNLYVTGPLGIWIWDPNGNHVGTIVMPEQPANLAWGGSDWSTLYITARTSVYRLPSRTHGFVPYALKMSGTR